MSDEVTIPEAAKLLGISDRAVAFHAASGRIAGRRIGKRLWLLKREEVERYGRERKRGGWRPRRPAIAEAD